MKVIVSKISKLGLLKLKLVLGALTMLVAVVGLPVGILCADATLLANPYVLGVILIAMFLFALVGYFSSVRPYFMYKKYPDVQAETDGEFLYIHTNKEAKIPLSQLSEATVRFELPFILQKEFISDIIIHLFSGEYGDVILSVPKYGTFKMRFVANARESASELAGLIDETLVLE